MGVFFMAMAFGEEEGLEAASLSRAYEKQPAYAL
jgi:hypothetical protein